MMASSIKDDDEEIAPDHVVPLPDKKQNRVLSHDLEHFIDIHGSESNKSLPTMSQNRPELRNSDNISSSDHGDSKPYEENSDSFIQSSSLQDSAFDLNLPVQETEGFPTSATVIHQDSDEEYQSAEEGEDEEDDFIPTSDMLSTDATTETKIKDSVEARLSEESWDADESETEDTSHENEALPEREELEAIDPLETRRKLEETLSSEEKQDRKTKSQEMKDEGNVKFRLGEFDEAILSYTAALDLCPLDFHKERSVMFANRAACKMKQEFFEDAISDSSSALELHPHYLKAMLRRAELYEKTEKLDEALKDYQKVVELDPSQHAARAACLKLAEQIKDRNEKMKDEMIGKLKDLGNMVLRPFGLSVNNFNLQQDPQTGSYSVQFNQRPGNGT